MNTPDNQQQDQHLDQLLREWSDKQALDSAELSHLEQDVLKQLAENKQTSKPTLLRQTSRVPGWRYAAGISAIAAVVLVAFILGRHWEQQRLEDANRQLALHSSMEDQNALKIFDPASLKPLQAQQRQRILNEFQGVFDQQITWIADVDGELKVGLASTGQNMLTADPRYLAIRLTLLSNLPNQTGWEVEQSYEVLANAEELLQIPLSADGNAKLTVWAYPVEDDLVSIETQCHLTGVYSQQVDASHLQPLGQHNQIHTFEQDGIEYRLYQTAVLLEPT